MAYFSDQHDDLLCDPCGTLRFGSSGIGHWNTGYKWAPRYSMQYRQCTGCGSPVDPRPHTKGWEAPCTGPCAPYHSLGCGHAPSIEGYWHDPERRVSARTA